jgi:CubicO group peptidase (beta-lactamase class C family)
MRRWNTDGATRRRYLATAFAAIVCAAAAVVPTPGKSESAVASAPVFSRESLERIGGFIRNEITNGKIPGGILLIQQHGKPVYFESFGQRDAAAELPMTSDTIFQVYSMSKAVTSVAAMMLVDDGKLALDDPVEKYIPAFADAKVGVDDSDEAGQPPLRLVPLKRSITIRDLLRHTSGITYGFYGESAVRKLYGNPKLFAGDPDNAEFADRIARLPLADQPGVRWDYGHSTDVLGRVIEVASGQSLYQFEKQRLFDPLHMPDTNYYVANEANWTRIARPLPGDRFASPLAGIKDPKLPRRFESGGAGLNTTIADYSHFLQMMINKGTLDGKRYLKPETVAEMTKDQIGPETGIIHDPFYFPSPNSGFGLGFAIRTSSPPGTTWPLGEYRWDGAAGAFYFVDPVDDMFVIFMVHSPTQGGRIQLALKTIMYEALGKGLRKGD